MTAKTRKISEIQYLRAFAILFVFFRHCPGIAPRLLPYCDPSTGVDLFFVISGYVIGLTFIRKYDEACQAGQSISGEVRRFYVRRFFRLYPAAMFWIVATLLFGWISRNPQFWLTPLELARNVLYSALSVRDFTELVHPTPLGYYWSLSLENQFYLMLPLLLLIRPIRARLALLVALCILFLFYRPGGTGWWCLRCDGLLYGVLLYYFCSSEASHKLKEILPRSRRFNGCIAIAGLFLVVWLPRSLERHYPMAYGLVCWSSVVLVYLAHFGEGFLYLPERLKPWAEWAGERSYSIYLCHLPAIFIVRDVYARIGLDRPGSLVQGSAGLPILVLIFLFSELSYRYVEVPLQKRGQQIAKRESNVLTKPVAVAQT